MILVIIDPVYDQDAKLIAQKQKLDKALATWPCKPGSAGYILISHDPTRKVAVNCSCQDDKTGKDLIDLMSHVLYGDKDK